MMVTWTVKRPGPDYRDVLCSRVQVIKVLWAKSCDIRFLVSYMYLLTFLFLLRRTSKHYAISQQEIVKYIYLSVKLSTSINYL